MHTESGPRGDVIGKSRMLRCDLQRQITSRSCFEINLSVSTSMGNRAGGVAALRASEEKRWNQTGPSEALRSTALPPSREIAFSDKQRSVCLQAAIFSEGMSGACSGSSRGRSLLMLTTALLLSLTGLLSGLPGSTEAKDCDKPCMNGQCNAASGSCVCFPGWVGDQCQHCGGRFRYSPTRKLLFTAKTSRPRPSAPWRTSERLEAPEELRDS
ncbi:unnamed protein product [Pleuronectes platessa]|uniref:EGF-like domain-containing protein n=1 Tax=Pleuronectes platessa TaxID=8262 RepID=A0A9N7YP29_PLEPL|nr:unnamed protein product [Pleuronectes platessa]